ncbi:hypothetical protein PPSIR1_03578 [Plesiocystis pacifica SIR-1]|uniref:Uncharacterized protein n=1 Tax=Plesiocystis pacifica SIR-1 TaxID=391625 RepID=A6G5H5_9BACT|nr:hypothetical protein [Plesiocystis pacifica]EDM78918.1 hypothetical protein PPSIR1_03578 [Plesiocystis pacifica SIR-1]
MAEASEPSEHAPAGAWARWRYWLIVLVLALVAVFARRDAIDTGVVSDDYMHHAMLAGIYPATGEDGRDRRPFDLYAFLPADAEGLDEHAAVGTTPWWSVLPNDPDADGGSVRFAVLRPLSSALLTLDHALFPGRSARRWHLHSLLWLLAAIAGAALVWRRLFGEGLAVLAVALLACDPSWCTPLAWIANRCALVGATFGFLALAAHIYRRPIRSRSEGEPPPERARRLALVEAASLALAMAAGEYGLVAAAYVLAYELVAARGSVRERLVALAPATALALAYLALHRLLGYGTYGEVYANVFEAPSAWLSTASHRLPRLITAGLWSIPAETTKFLFQLDAHAPWADPGEDFFDFIDYHQRVAWLGVGLSLTLAIPARLGLHEHERRGLRALVLGAFLGLIPLCSAPAQVRLLVLTQLGACALMAGAALGCVRLVRGLFVPPQDRETGPSRGLALAGLALGAPPLLLALGLNTAHDLRWGQDQLDELIEFQRQSLAAFTQGDIGRGRVEPERLDGADVVVLNATSITTALHGSYVLDYHDQPLPRSWRPLAIRAPSFVAERRGAKVLELSAVDGGWLRNPAELNFRRSSQLLYAGDVRERPGLRVEVLADVQGFPTRVRFHFDVPLEELLFLHETKAGLVEWTPPPIGGNAPVPFARMTEID